MCLSFASPLQNISALGREGLSYLSPHSGKGDRWTTQRLPPAGGTEAKRGREPARMLRAGLSEEVALGGVLTKGDGGQPGSDVGNSVLSRRNSKGKCSLRETRTQDAGPGQDAGLGCRTRCRTGTRRRRGHLVRVMETLGDGFCSARHPSHLPFQR